METENLENSIKAIENCVNKAVADYEEVYFKKDSSGKACISQINMNDGRLITRLCSKFKTILHHLENLKEELKTLNLELEGKNKKINELIKENIELANGNKW